MGKPKSNKMIVVYLFLGLLGALAKAGNEDYTKVLSHDLRGGDLSSQVDAARKNPYCLSVFNPKKSECPPGWKESDKRSPLCYKYFDSKENWKRAKSNCEKEKAVLASIHDESTNSFLTQLTERKEAWVGGYRTGKMNDDFSWVDGSSWDFINWKIHQPDNANSKENYVMINFRIKSEKRQNKQVAYGLWNDAQEKWKIGYVCQIKKIPATAAGPTTAAATTSSCLGAVSQCGDGTSTPLGTCCDGYECVPLSATAAYCAESSTSSTTTSTCGGSGSNCLDTTGAATYPGCCTGFSCTPPSSGTIFTCV